MKIPFLLFHIFSQYYFFICALPPVKKSSLSVKNKEKKRRKKPGIVLPLNENENMLNLYNIKANSNVIEYDVFILISILLDLTFTSIWFD